MDKFEPKTKTFIPGVMIEVVPDLPELRQQRNDYMNNCRKIVTAIKRHVDNIGGVIITDPQVCVYCGMAPEPESITGEPCCCEKAYADYEAWKKDQANKDKP